MQTRKLSIAESSSHIRNAYKSNRKLADQNLSALLRAQPLNTNSSLDHDEEENNQDL